MGQDEDHDAARQPGRRLPRRAFLRRAGYVGAAALGTAGAMGVARAGRPYGPSDRGAATVPVWPDAGLVELAVIWQVPTSRRAVALTFDDGPDPRWTPHVLDLLAAAGARATFFCCGRAAAAHPDLVRRAAAQGEIGNHSWTHPDLAREPPARVTRELARTHHLLAELAGRPPTLFRPPYGATSGPVLAAAAHHGYRIVLWSEEAQRRGVTAAADVDRLLGELRPGQIVLAHDGRGDRSGVLERLPALLAGLRRAGLEAVPVGELLTAWQPPAR